MKVERWILIFNCHLHDWSRRPSGLMCLIQGQGAEKISLIFEKLLFMAMLSLNNIQDRERLNKTGVDWLGKQASRYSLRIFFEAMEEGQRESMASS